MQVTQAGQVGPEGLEEAYQARRQAKTYIREICANYSYSSIVIAESLVSWLWNRI